MKQEYVKLITDIKLNILISRYMAAKLANREQLLLYLRIGKSIQEKSQSAAWGSKVLDKISADLQQELPGLRGFSAGNLKKMRQLYNDWQPYFQIGSTLLSQFENGDYKQDTTLTTLTEFDFNSALIDQLQGKSDKENEISSTMLSQLKESFFSLGFSLHILILSKTTELEERLFYILETTKNFWSFRVLQKHLIDNLFQQKGKLPNNFKNTLTEKISNKAVRMFKDEYLWEFIDAEDEDNEPEVEREIVMNIKKFMMSLGGDFAFMGNQYRVIVDERELFIDLLFYHRKLQCLVAFELKTTEFKAEHVGKMNLYLSALDEYVKQPFENPSIGIILCKSKSNKFVEFAFRDFNKPMGVATYKTNKEIPNKYKNALPDIEKLKELI